MIKTIITGDALKRALARQQQWVDRQGSSAREAITDRGRVWCVSCRRYFHDRHQHAPVSRARRRMAKADRPSEPR